MRDKWWHDARAILAILAVVGAFSQQAYILVVTKPTAGEIFSIPTWQAATVSAIVGFYFGARGGSSGDTGNGGSSSSSTTTDGGVTTTRSGTGSSATKE